MAQLRVDSKAVVLAEKTADGKVDLKVEMKAG